MSQNKNALTRYLIYDQCLRNTGRNYTWKDLQEEVNRVLIEEGYTGIGKTTVFEDLKHLEFSTFQAPIIKNKIGKIAYYRYSDPHFSIKNTPLNVTEIEQLKAAISILSRVKGLPQFEWINELIPTLETKLGIIKTESEVIGFEWNFDYIGLQFFSAIFNAIVNKRVLSITYRDFKQAEPYQITIHPYYLKQFNNRWYLLGLNEATGISTWTMALDRMVDITETNTPLKPCKIDWEGYFSNFIGITKLEGEPVDVEIAILDKEQMEYIKTNPLHETQKPFKQIGDQFMTTIKVVPNYELEKLILSFGDRIMVNKPEDLREKIIKRLTEGGNNYFRIM
jgi:predicted DNA-binding transcriptional regulator YafY